MPVNQSIAQIFMEISQMMDLLGMDSFRSSAHARAARSIASLSFDLEPIAGERAKLMEIEGIGAKMADKIVEFCKTGKVSEHEELTKQVPPGLGEMLRIDGLGPKTARAIWQCTGAENLEQLAKVIEDGSILQVPRLGAKAVEKIKKSLQECRQPQEQRLWIGRAMPIAEMICDTLAKVPGVEQVAYAGSLRRGKDTVGDLDILVAAQDPGPVSEAFRALPQVATVLVAGGGRSSVRLKIEASFSRRGGLSIPSIQADLRVLPKESWGAALMYFTGSKDHNIRLRERALKMGYALSDFGLFTVPDSGSGKPAKARTTTKDKPKRHEEGQFIAGATEEEVYAALGLPYIPPEIREDRGELDLKETPRFIEVADIRAELHAHTTTSDGALEIEELAAKARERGFHTIAVTDHSKSSAFAGGLSPDALLQHAENVRKANEWVKGITILAGSEVDIHADGSLDYEDHILKALDIVVASPHAALTQEPEAATRRLLEAIKNPFVHILGHPTGRLINRRNGLSPDMAKVVAAAKEHNVALEINAHWHRLDLRDIHVRAAVDAGCLIAINCDVHAESDFDNLRYGILTARRGWLRAESCINTWPADKLHGWLKAKGRR
jgi:DNA polymerase (family X)